MTQHYLRDERIRRKQPKQVLVAGERDTRLILAGVLGDRALLDL
jgi:hypothetical protein